MVSKTLDEVMAQINTQVGVMAHGPNTPNPHSVEVFGMSLDNPTLRFFGGLPLETGSGNGAKRLSGLITYHGFSAENCLVLPGSRQHPVALTAGPRRAASFVR